MFLLEEMLEHVVRDLLGASAIDLVDFLGVWVVRIKSSELTLLVTKQQQEVRAVTSVHNIQNPLTGVSVNSTWEDDVLNGIQDDGTVGLGCWLSVQTGAWKGKPESTSGSIFMCKRTSLIPDLYPYAEKPDVDEISEAPSS